MQAVELNNDVEIPILGFGVFQTSDAITKLHRLEENLGANDIELILGDIREIENAASKITIQGARYSEHQDRLIDR